VRRPSSHAIAERQPGRQTHGQRRSVSAEPGHPDHPVAHNRREVREQRRRAIWTRLGRRATGHRRTAGGRDEREGGDMPMTREPDDRLVALYARGSSDRQDVDLSVAAQLRALRAYAAQHGHVVAREYLDEAESGRVADRPQFRQLIDEGSRYNAPPSRKSGAGSSPASPASASMLQPPTSSCRPSTAPTCHIPTFRALRVRATARCESFE